MQLQWTIYLLAYVSGALSLKANQLCGDSVECANSCEGGRYHIVSDKDATFFGCKSDSLVVDYQHLTCTADGEAACEAAAGIYCVDDCVALSKNKTAYTTACKGAGGEASGSKALTYDDAHKAAACL